MWNLVSDNSFKKQVKKRIFYFSWLTKMFCASVFTSKFSALRPHSPKKTDKILLIFISRCAKIKDSLSIALIVLCVYYDNNNCDDYDKTVSARRSRYG